MEILENGYGWIEFTFRDGSRQLVFTSMNADIMRSRGIQYKKGFVYDLRHEEYVLIRDDAVRVLVYSEKPDAKEGLQSFADRFI